LRVADRVLEGGLRHAHGARGDVDAPDFEPREHLLEPAPLDSAHQVRDRHAEVLEVDLAGLDALVAQLVDVAPDGEAGRVLLGGEQADALVRRIGARIGLHHQRIDGGGARVGDEHLGAVHHVVVALAARGGADALRIAAGVGLRQAERRPVLAARHGGQVALLLLPRAVRAEHVGEHEVRVEDAREAHPAAAELLDDHRVGGVVEAEAAVLERDGGAEEPELLHALDQRLRVLVGVLVAARDRHHLALDEAPDRVEHLLGELLAIVHDSPLDRATEFTMFEYAGQTWAGLAARNASTSVAASAAESGPSASAGCAAGLPSEAAASSGASAAIAAGGGGSGTAAVSGTLAVCWGAAGSPCWRIDSK